MENVYRICSVMFFCNPILSTSFERVKGEKIGRNKKIDLANT